MSVLEALNATIADWTSKLPRWVNVLLGLWLFFAAAVYFSFVELPEIGWWRLVIMAPMVPVVVAVMLQILAITIAWLIAPFRWLLKKWRSAAHG